MMSPAGRPLSVRRFVAVAEDFLRKGLKSQRRPPQTVTLDGYAAVRELKADGALPTEIRLRSSRCLDNLIEQTIEASSSALQ